MLQLAVSHAEKNFLYCSKFCAIAISNEPDISVTNLFFQEFDHV